GLGERSKELGLISNVEIILLPCRQHMLSPQDRLDLRLCHRDLVLADRQHSDVAQPVAPHHAELRSRQRDQHEVIRIVSETPGLTLRFQDADYLKLKSAD